MCFCWFPTAADPKLKQETPKGLFPAILWAHEVRSIQKSEFFLNGLDIWAM